VDSILRPLRELLSALLFLAVTVRLVDRFRGSTRLMQRTLEPVLTVAAARCVLLAIAIGVRLATPDSEVLDGMVWAIALAVPVMAAAFFLGLVLRRLYTGRVLEDLGGRVRRDLAPRELRATLADALGDPSLQMVYWTGDAHGHWVDDRGRPRAAPEPDSRHLTEVSDGKRPVAAIWHDPALSKEPEFLEAVASYALSALRNQRLTTQVESALNEVRESRSRLLAGADRERRRIERDLHDGAQQRLVALRIQLELLEETMEWDPEKGMEKLHALGEEVGETLEEIRSLAHGVFPSLLADRGLAEALRAAALRAPISTRVRTDGVGRYPQDVESAVYFCCLEAMQNASKHARDARAVTISLRQDRALRFEVRDDGAGFDSLATPGAGLTNMQDRLAAVGGHLNIRSTGGGTVVRGSVPLVHSGSNGARSNGASPAAPTPRASTGRLGARWSLS
jgi:signal transduction histidine kinase